MTESPMFKLISLKPLVSRLPDRFGPVIRNEQQRSRYRDATQPWRAWYKLERWRKLRIQQFIADHFTCRMCGKVEGNTSKLVCDHVDPHRGDYGKFWNGPKQTLCKSPCHDKHKQAQEHAGVWDWVRSLEGSGRRTRVPCIRIIFLQTEIFS